VTGVRALDVLIVDDDDADAMMIEEALQGAPVPPVVHRVIDGSQALEYLRREGEFADAVRPDLILLDLNMPRMGGREVLAHIRRDSDLTAIPIVVLTTSDAVPDIVASYDGHANAYVTKPMELDAFEAAVQKISRFYGDVATLPAFLAGGGDPGQGLG
jgi:CheY-like chemotaxis protein